VKTDTRSSTHRTTLELDLAELNRAKATLGTKTIRETVNRALREVNRQPTGARRPRLCAPAGSRSSGPTIFAS
jgi:hypothetical protein